MVLPYQLDNGIRNRVTAAYNWWHTKMTQTITSYAGSSTVHKTLEKLKVKKISFGIFQRDNEPMCQQSRTRVFEDQPYINLYICTLCSPELDLKAMKLFGTLKL